MREGVSGRANTAAILRGLAQELLAVGDFETAEALFAAAAAYEVHGRPSPRELVEFRTGGGVPIRGAVYDPLIEDPEVSGRATWDGKRWLGETLLSRILRQKL